MLLYLLPIEATPPGRLSVFSLTDNYKVTTRIAYLEVSRLRKIDTVIFDLTCNFAPSVHKAKVASKVKNGVGKGRMFHLLDSEGIKLGLRSAGSIDQLIKRISLFTGSVSAKDVLVVNLTPMPRYQ